MALIHNKSARFYTYFVFYSIAFFSQYTTTISNQPPASFVTQPLEMADSYTLEHMNPTIRNIVIQGNVVAPKAAILHKIPFKPGQVFNYIYTSEAIKKIYELGFFKQVQLALDEIDEQTADLYIIVQEKPKLTDVIIQGNKGLRDKDIYQAINLERLVTLDEREVPNLLQKIQKAYIKKNYHNVTIDHTYEQNHKNHTAKLTIAITEGKPAYIKRITFTGNKRISSKQLKKIIFSREDWVLSFLDHSGSYQEEMVQADKMILEHTYRNHGFMHAKVKDATITYDKKEDKYHITYDIHEGDQYYITELKAEGNDLLSEQDLLQRLPLRKYMPYSEEGISKSIETLKMLWGEFGYIFADIEPSIDVDDKKKTVSITFYSDLKDKITLNRLSIKGNKKTRDYVIRRNVNLKEGKLLTNQKMEVSKAAVQRLGFFDEKAGVEWKINRIDDQTADLDLMLTEKRTGRLEYSMNYGGNPQNMNTPQTGLTAKLLGGDRNLFGSGVSMHAEVEYGKSYKTANFHIVQPWLFQKPLRGELNAYLRRSEYTEGLYSTQGDPEEEVFGGIVGLGYLSSWLNGIMTSARFGFEEIRFKQQGKNTHSNPIQASAGLATADQQEFQNILNANFKNGGQYWTEWSLSQDLRNGIAFPTTGHKISWTSRFAFPIANSPFGYFKTLLDASWYTPLIGQDSLVLCLHGQGGFIKKIQDKAVPWRELYHIGGPATIRGYNYGQIGPTWKDKNSLGAQKMLCVNLELIAPVTADRGTRVVVFYDGGAGWDTPNASLISAQNLNNNTFFYRHSFGLGIRMTSPTPVQVDWGIKLNPSKKFRGDIAQMHLSMIHEF